MSDGNNVLDQKISRLRSKYSRLQNAANMQDATRTLGDVSTTITGFPAKIATIRDRGYVFASYLEHKVEVLKDQWEGIRRQVQSAVRNEVDRIQDAADELSDMWSRLDARSTDSSRERIAEQIENAMDSLDNAVDGARRRIEGLYGNVPENVSQTESQIAKIETYLKRAEDATFEWKPAEAIFMAVEAEWVRTGKGKNDPDGVLYVTDQRLLFEQKEKVGGRFGFGGEHVQELQFEAVIGTATEVTPEDKGLFGGKDLIHLKFSAGEHSEATFEVKGGIDSKAFAAQLTRVVSGEIDKERAVPVDEAVVEAVQSAPTACATCGATLPAVVRGMTEIACEYCGTVVRI